MPENVRIALVFPGQGCQFVGMGADLYDRYPEARAVYQEADDTVGYLLSKLCFEGSEAELNDTANTQPAIVATSLALWAALKPRLNGEIGSISFAAGHSLGEYTALAAAGALATADAIRLVRRRGLAMRQAGEEHPGGMAVIIGLDDDGVREIAALACDADGHCWVANYNSPGQVVIAGASPALERAMALAKERRAKRALPLAVSVACHTAYMQGAAVRFNDALEHTSFHRPWAPIVSNVTASALHEPRDIKEALLQQLTSPVRWVESVQYLADHGVTQAIEVGPKAVVSGLMRRISAALAINEVTGVEALQAFCAQVPA